MSLSESLSVAPKQGHPRKIVSIHVPQNAATDEEKREAAQRLRTFFERAADAVNRDGLLKTIDRFLLGEGLGDEIAEGALTRRQRKQTRRIGFDVRHRAHVKYG